MKSPVDARLPPQLAQSLVAAGHDAVHTLSLSEGDRSTDLAAADDRVLIIKDGDMRGSHRLRASRRLIVTTGDIGDDALLAMFDYHLGLPVTASESAGMVEVGRDSEEVIEELKL